MSLQDRVCSVMRSVGERTAGACRTLLGDQVGGPDRVVTVGGKPFPETLADGLRAGIASGKTWTLCLDADVLPLPGAVEALVAEADRLDPAIVEVQPVVLDRFFGGWRPAGVHLYRTAHLPFALDVLARMEPSIRPETALLQELATHGMAWCQSAAEFGLHDFEQAPGDIYRKCFVHARKHADLRPALKGYWSARAASPDFAVALQGLAAGAAHDGPIELDVRAGYMSWPSDPAAVLPLATPSPLRMLEAEEGVLASLSAQAPVWDWLDSVWPDEHECRDTIEAFIRRLLGARTGPWFVDRLDARTRAFVRAAARWGLGVAGVIDTVGTGRGRYCGVPVVDDAVALPPGAGRVSRDGGGRFVARFNDRCVHEPAPRECAPPLAPGVAVDGLVDRIERERVGRILVYGAGAMGAACADALAETCHVAAFVESEPSPPRLRLRAPVLSPEQALAAHREADVVIASLGSAPAMVRRLLAAASETMSPPRRIWLMDAR
jgi:hypothetical protein